MTRTTSNVPDDSPALGDDFFARARPMRETHSKATLDDFKAKSKGGRPKADVTKTAISIRLDERILDAVKRDGDGWQTRLNDALLSLLVVDPSTKAEVLRPKRGKAA